MRFVNKKINRLIYKNNFSASINNSIFKIKSNIGIFIQHSNIRSYKGNIFKNKFLNLISTLIRILTGLSKPWKKSQIVINYTKEESKNFRSKSILKYFYIPLFSDLFSKKNYEKRTENFAYIGRFNNNDKNLVFLREVGEEIYKLSKLSIDVYGDGPEGEIFNRALGKGINLKGRLNNLKVIETLSKYKTLILVSNYEGFSFVIVEALASGTFTIARNTFETIHFLLDNNRGKIIDKKATPKEFALESLKTINNSENINRDNLVNFFNENLTEKKFHKNWTEVINYIKTLN